jgi:hypothetical protein
MHVGSLIEKGDREGHMPDSVILIKKGDYSIYLRHRLGLGKILPRQGVLGRGEAQLHRRY